MKYVNKKTGDIVGSEVYSQLSTEARSNFIAIDTPQQSVTKTHQVIEPKSDSMSVGDGIAAVVALPIVAIWSLFD